MDWRDPKASEGVINAFAYRVWRRYASTGASLEDIRQDLWIAWCQAVKCFDETKGVPFHAYLRLGMRNHANRHFAVNVGRRKEEVYGISVNAEIDGLEGKSSLIEILPDPTAIDPADEYERNDLFATAMKRLSEPARIFLRILENQPPELLESMEQIHEKSEHARAMNLPYAVPKRISAALIFDLMGTPRSQRTKIIREIEKLGERFTR